MNPPTTPTQNEVRLDEIKKRCEAATKGPWYMAGIWTVLSEQNSGDMIANLSTHDDLMGNGNFIAHARTDIPALVEMVERLQRDLIQSQRLNKDLCEEGLKNEAERDSLRGQVEGLEKERIQAGADMLKVIQERNNERNRRTAYGTALESIINVKGSPPYEVARTFARKALADSGEVER